ncbi:Ferredoxin:thioredoxin reductase [Handroanthus impetiginosus]|uniref:Ferredoxin:thioredoxin reductase n=1 Tax=Handroanthus impetiginosus TaxID=429701 RepID=A0A2G9GU64_9LAMI|nr:Ferredoxin:thioredoxin reductase [Handroanthus impetiginosus]
MTTCPFFSSLSNIPGSKITHSYVGFPNIKSFVRKKPFFSFISIVDNSPSCSCNSITISNSVSLDHDSVSDEELKKAESKFGSRVRVKVPLKVYHAPKLPEFKLTGRVSVLKDYVGLHQGKRISANLPYKVEFVADEVLGRDGKPVKFTAHLREDEFEFFD